MTMMPHRPSRRPYGLLAIAATATIAACNADRAAAPDIPSPSLLANRISLPDQSPKAVSVRVAKMQPNATLASINGVTVYGGGFGSAIDASPWRKDVFYSLTDRGPNVSGTGNDKLFVMPSFHPQIGRFHLRGDVLVRDEVITLKDANGNPLTGVPPAPGATGNSSEVPKTLDGTPIAYDPNGIDSEGLRVMWDGSFWVSDEYGPFLTHFDRWGRTIERNSPIDGPHPLPLVLLNRQPNKGMEGLASILGGRVLVGMIQNPLNNPKAAAKTSQLLRIVFIDVVTGKTKQFAYLLDDAKYGVSEIEAISPTRFIVVERDGKFLNDSIGGASVQKKLYMIDIAGATDVSDPSNGAKGLQVGPVGNQKTLEQLSVADFATNHIVPVKKTLIVDMLAFGYTHDKAEGITIIDEGRTIAVSNDDDFGVTDDGAGHLIQKFLPSGVVDHNEVWFFKLNRSLYEVK